MAKLKFKDIKAWDAKESDAKKRELYKELMKLRSQASVGTTEDPGRIRAIKRTIARIFTAKNQKGAVKAPEERAKK